MTEDLVQVLLVEDNDIDREAVRRAFRQHQVGHPIVEARDGVEALQILRGQGRPRLARPFMVLLDLNLPRMNGIEFLTELRGDDELQDSVVFVLTTSDREEDLADSYARQVAGYILKSSVGQGYHHLVNLLDSYWRVVELPEGMGE
jgi:CheY-like chemotaxis protein